MRCFAAMFETECFVARTAFKGKEVELAAVFELAVTADRFEVFVYHCLRKGGG